MKEIKSTDTIRQMIEDNNILDLFDTKDLVFQAYRYARGELINSPDTEMDRLLFVTEGTVSVYGIRSDGSIAPVNELSCGSIIGDMEFSRNGSSVFFAEAKTYVSCLSLSLKKYRQQLNNDNRFLHVLLQSYASKMEFSARNVFSEPNLETRLLTYMKKVCPDNEIKGLETVIVKLHCSRRQLQRILKKLSDEGIIEKQGRGKYRLK